MRAMVFTGPGVPLLASSQPIPAIGREQVLVRVEACGVCRTDLHIVDGELTDPCLPLIPGHQIVGIVEAVSDGVAIPLGTRVGVPWLGHTCGRCKFCQGGQENLCDQAGFTGYSRNGGFAEYCAADARYCFPIPPAYSPEMAAPLLCAGLIGYRSYRMAGPSKAMGFYGFGSAAHILTQLAVHQGRQVYAFVRPGDDAAKQFALNMGAVWAGNSTQKPPVELGSAIIFAALGSLVKKALGDVQKGGRVVCAGIHMSDIPSIPYSLLWGERCLVSVANLTRRDGEEFLAIAPQVPVRTEVTCYPLESANDALTALRDGTVNGSIVLTPNQ